MSVPHPEVVSLAEGRFARLEAIEWWDQRRLTAAKVLVIGAGALGNEVLKNLALLGVGHVAIADQDHVELSNLSRSVLFRESDEGQPKALCAARALQEIYPGIRVYPLVGNVIAELGLGWFRWADVVVGALDNREARVFVNSACARMDRPWVDGGIEVLQGIVRAFYPPRTPCYECTMSKVDWDLIDKRRSCSLVARRAMAQRGTPTTPTSASVIGAIQAQEVVKILHGMDGMLGRGFFFDGQHHSSYGIDYQIHEDCPWHEAQPEIVSSPDWKWESPLAILAKEAEARLGGLDALDFGREIVERMECLACGLHTPVWRAAEQLGEHELHCSSCGAECSPRVVHSLTPAHPAMQRSARELGLPERDVLWARRGERQLGMELAAESGFEDRCQQQQNQNITP
ncbi:ThiF family adenylyltransferase [Roseimicrobium sp. ORNL1]|uniref:HesA/MoeB/ThiF family protein n=1 Tax=Roseimicrobium sp. ORNL1 TaxID=2711231 RepID=UPI0013E19DBD|nr:ThiF family adenylyltransferase [Roseimicrobium sp. ORNL1]QIF02701.1 ThiF family adenylyltransferase [Roseimicrobium sp. ORNL1]